MLTRGQFKLWESEKTSLKQKNLSCNLEEGNGSITKIFGKDDLQAGGLTNGEKTKEKQGEAKT